MKTTATITIECENINELRTAAKGIPTHEEHTASVLYTEGPTQHDRYVRQSFADVVKERDAARANASFWKAQAEKFARRIKQLERKKR